MDSAVESMSSIVSPPSARQTLGRRWGRKRGATVEDKAKAICFQRRRDITGVQARMQPRKWTQALQSPAIATPRTEKALWTKGLNTLVTLTPPCALVTFWL